MTRRRIPVNELNQPLGEARKNTKVPDEVVVRIRDLHERHGLAQPEIARRLGVNFYTVRSICQYVRRRMVYRDWRSVEDNDDAPQG